MRKSKRKNNKMFLLEHNNTAHSIGNTLSRTKYKCPNVRNGPSNKASYESMSSALQECR